MSTAASVKAKSLEEGRPLAIFLPFHKLDAEEDGASILGAVLNR